MLPPPKAQPQADPNESAQDALLRQIKAEKDVQDVRDYAAAYRKWTGMPRLRQEACLRGCPDITGEERRLLRHPPSSVSIRISNMDSPSPGWAWEGDDVPATLNQWVTGAAASVPVSYTHLRAHET